MAMMQIKDLRKYLETAVKFKEQVDAFEFQLDIIEVSLKDILFSDDLELLPRDVQESMIIPRVRALRYWKVQLDDYKDKHLVALMNVLKNVRSTELDVTLEEAKMYFTTPDEVEDIIQAKAKAVEAAAKTVIIEPMQDSSGALNAHIMKPTEEEIEIATEVIDTVAEILEPVITKAKSDDDILARLMAEQKS